MNREILRLAIPNIISNISIPLLSTVDTALMGHLSAAHLGAVGLGTMLFNFIYWNFGFLRMGTTGLCAQAFGERNDEKIKYILFRSCIVAIGIAGMLILFQRPILELGKDILNAADITDPLITAYFNIRIWAAPASLALYSLLGWYFGMQNAWIPLVITVAINVINIVLSYIAVRHLGMGIEGVAWGTVIAQYSGMLIALVFLFIKYRIYIRISIDRLFSQNQEWLKFLRVNADLFIRTVGLTFAFGFFYSQSSEEGTLVLAANIILLQFLNWMSYGVDGFAYAAESLIGKYVGAGNRDRLILALKRSFQWGGGLALLFAIFFFFSGNWIISIFTEDQGVHDLAYRQMYWIVILPLIGFVCYIWDGIYIGFTASKEMRNSMILALFIYLFVYYFTMNLWTNAIWIAFVLFMAGRGLIQSVIWFKSPVFRIAK